MNYQKKQPAIAERVTMQSIMPLMHAIGIYINNNFQAGLTKHISYLMIHLLSLVCPFAVIKFRWREKIATNILTDVYFYFQYTKKINR